MAKGKFIVFEGCEGVGKSTQIEFLRKYLEDKHIAAVFTREPGGTPLGEAIRELILKNGMGAECEAHLFAASRAEHIDKVILPALKEGKTVVCDRYVDSSLAYQGFARGLGTEKVKRINEYSIENCLPDAVIFLNMRPSESWRRRKGRVVEDDRLEKETDFFHNSVYRGFLELAGTEERFIPIVPDCDKLITRQKIIDALKTKNLIP